MMYMRRRSPPSVKGSLSSVPPRGMPYTCAPPRLSQPATIMPACILSLFAYASCITSCAATRTSIQPGVSDWMLRGGGRAEEEEASARARAGWRGEASLQGRCASMDAERACTGLCDSARTT